MLTSSTRTLFKLTKEANDPHLKSQQTRKASRLKEMPDPADVLNYKKHECRFITEVHMGKKDADAIHPNFQSFTNLEILWLNDNKLEKVDNLLPEVREHSVADSAKGASRLRRLYLSNNRINTLLGDIQRLKYLEVLLLANNKLSNMEVVSQQLSHLRFLQQLDLFGNPLSEERDYRFFIIHNHKSVTLFDRQSVTDDERKKAKEIFAPVAQTVAKVGFGSHTIPGKEMERVDAISASTRIIEARAKNITIQNNAAKQFEEAREENEFQSMAEKRRLFHSLWGSKPGAYMENPNMRGMSKLFDLNDKDTDVAKLIQLAAEREQTESDERKALLDKEIAAMKTALFPSRLGDEYQNKLNEAKSSTFREDLNAFYAKYIPIVLLPEEQQAFRRVFDSGLITKNDMSGMVRVLQNGLDSAVRASIVERGFEEWFPSHAKDGSGVEMAEAEALLVSCIPLVQARLDQHFIASQASFAAGQPQISQQYLSKANAVNDLLKLLKENATSPSQSCVQLHTLSIKTRMGNDYAEVRDRHHEGSKARPSAKRF